MDEDVATFGIVDAVACDGDGRPEIVVDWKSDIAVDAATIASYRGQLARYLDMVGAATGLLVFVSTGAIVRIDRTV